MLLTQPAQALCLFGMNILMRAELPQKGNPYQLAVKQHTFPKRSIERFAQEGGVETKEPAASRILRRKPSDPLFVAMRAWDHKTEQLTLAEIDRTYQRIAEDVVNGRRELTEFEHDAITEFYCSWLVRHDFKKLPKGPLLMRPTGLERSAEDDDLAEQMESNGIIYCRRDGSVGAHVFNGPTLFMHIGDRQERMKGTRWGIVEAHPGDGEFLVPDTFSRYPIVPLSPRLCFIAGFTTHTALYTAIADINGIAVSSAENYYFARSLADCPIQKSVVMSSAIRQAFPIEGLPWR